MLFNFRLNIERSMQRGVQVPQRWGGAGPVGVSIPSGDAHCGVGEAMQSYWCWRSTNLQAFCNTS